VSNKLIIHYQLALVTFAATRHVKADAGTCTWI